MFIGRVPPPDKTEAYKELKRNLTYMFSFIAVVRVAPYVLHYLSDEKEELKLEL